MQKTRLYTSASTMNTVMNIITALVEQVCKHFAGLDGVQEVSCICRRLLTVRQKSCQPWRKKVSADAVKRPRLIHIHAKCRKHRCGWHAVYLSNGRSQETSKYPFSYHWLFFLQLPLLAQSPKHHPLCPEKNLFPLIGRKMNCRSFLYFV